MRKCGKECSTADNWGEVGRMQMFLPVGSGGKVLMYLPLREGVVRGTMLLTVGVG